MSRIKIPQKKPHLIRGRKPTLFQRMAKIKDYSLVKAVREHPLLGTGTESVVDQCFSDDEILEELEREGIKTPNAAIKHFAIWDGIEVEDLIDADENFVDESPDQEEDVPYWWYEWDDHTSGWND